MGRFATTYATVTEEDRVWLSELWKSGETHTVRCRAHAVLLSSRRSSIVEISTILQVTYETINTWIRLWNEHGRDFVFDRKRSGRPPILDDKDREIIRKEVQENPQSPSELLKKAQKLTKKTFSRPTFRRVLRSLGFRWKRLKLSLRKQRDCKAFEQAKQELERMEQSAKVDVVYFDEAHFSTGGVVSYAWQRKGERTLIPISGGHRRAIQVLGFLSSQGSVRTYVQQSTIRGATVVKAINEYVKTVKCATVLVLDNASPHTCKAVTDQLESWAKKGLVLYRLPPYSPELNSIEHLWKKLKHRMLPPTAWENIEQLGSSLLTALKDLGKVQKLEPMPAL